MLGGCSRRGVPWEGAGPPCRGWSLVGAAAGALLGPHQRRERSAKEAQGLTTRRAPHGRRLPGQQTVGGRPEVSRWNRAQDRSDAPGMAEVSLGSLWAGASVGGLAERLRGGENAASEEG